MHGGTLTTVERIERAIAEAQAKGFVVRQDWFGGAASGMCELKGKRYLFLDLSLSPSDQLEQVLAALDTAQCDAVPQASPPRSQAA